MKDKTALIAILISLASLIYAAWAHHEARQARQALQAAQAAQPSAEVLETIALGALRKRELEFVRKVTPNFRRMLVDMLGEREADRFATNPTTFEELLEPFFFLADELGGMEEPDPPPGVDANRTDPGK